MFRLLYVHCMSSCSSFLCLLCSVYSLFYQFYVFIDVCMFDTYKRLLTYLITYLLINWRTNNPTNHQLLGERDVEREQK